MEMLHIGLTVTGSFFEVSRRGMTLSTDTADVISEAQFTKVRMPLRPQMLAVRNAIQAYASGIPGLQTPSASC